MYRVRLKARAYGFGGSTSQPFHLTPIPGRSTPGDPRPWERACGWRILHRRIRMDELTFVTLIPSGRLIEILWTPLLTDLLMTL